MGSNRLGSVFVNLIWFLPVILSWKQSYEYINVDVVNYPGRMFSTDLKLIGGDRLINGTIELLADITNKQKMSDQLYLNSGGGYKVLPMMIPETDSCSMLQLYYKKFVKDSFRTGINTNFDFQDGNVCPFPKGAYWIKDLIFDNTDWASVVPRGLIKSRINFTDNGEFVGGVEFVVDVKDKY